MSRKKKNGNYNGNGESNGNNNGQINGRKIPTKKAVTVVAKNENQKLLLKSIRDNIITIAVGSAGTGKAQRLSSLIYTPRGAIPLGKISIGDEVCTPDGGVARVLSIHPQGEKKFYRIYFSDGDFVDCCGDHLWKVRDRYHMKKTKFKTDERIVDTNFLVNKLKNRSKNNTSRFKIDTPNFCFFEERHVNIDPYLFGCLIGDGCLTNHVGISTGDEDIVEEVGILVSSYRCELRKKKSSNYDYSIRSYSGGHKKNSKETPMLASGRNC